MSPQGENAMLFLLRFECKLRILKPSWFVASTISSTGCSFFGKRLSCATWPASLIIVYRETGVEISTSAAMSSAISPNFFIFPLQLSNAFRAFFSCFLPLNSFHTLLVRFWFLSICNWNCGSSTFDARWVPTTTHERFTLLLFPITSSLRLLMMTKIQSLVLLLLHHHRQLRSLLFRFNPVSCFFCRYWAFLGSPCDFSTFCCCL